MALKEYVLLIIFLVPIGAALLVVATPRDQRYLIKLIAAAAGVVTLALSIAVFIQYDYGAGGFQFEKEYEWLKGLGITFHVGVDGISTPMVLLTGIVMATGVFISWNIDTRTKDFFVLFLVLVTGVLGTFISLDLFFLFFFYELAVLPMYLLIGVWGSTRKEYGALKLVLYLVASSALVWIAILLLYVKADMGTFDITVLSQPEAQARFAEAFQRTIFPLFLIGFGVLAGLWPFHTWSPDGHVAAPTAVSMLHAGVLMKLGAYGIIRVGMTLLPEGAQDWAIPFVIFATINVVYGAFSAMAQRDLKYVIGYSSVSHMGYVLMGLATLKVTGVNGAVLQMFSHGVMTALFFALVGVVYDRAHTRDISIFQGLAKRMGITAAFFTLAGLTSLGLPGLSGFISELLVFVGTFQSYPIVGIFGIIGAAITAVYILRLLARVFFGPLDGRWDKLPDSSKLETASMGALGVAIIFVGVYPLPFIRMIESAVKTIPGIT